MARARPNCGAGTVSMSDSRDDRTRRVLSESIGDARAELALTHFAEARVRLSITPLAARSANGRLLYAVAANMLSRFVGELVLAWPLESVPLPDVAGRSLPDYLCEIDTRPGRRVVVAGEWSPNLGSSATTAALHIGRVDRARGTSPLVSVGCSGWRAWIAADAEVEEVVSSTTPFGALCAACFAVAEIFKLMVLGVLEGDERERFRLRLVESAHYSAWNAQWVVQQPGAGESAEALPAVDLGDILQVGAGAVGNASAWALAHLADVTGHVRLLDAKSVDMRNLNRCLGFREADVGQPKTEALLTALPSTGIVWEGLSRVFDPTGDTRRWLYVSTVDNNAVRHQMQEALPQWLVQGSTNATQVAVSVHRPLGQRSCLVCRHPDRTLGLTENHALSVSAAAARLGVAAEVVAQSRFNGDEAIGDAFLTHVGQTSPDVAAFFVERRAAGEDLCGAIAAFRRTYGAVRGPDEPSVSFASALAGFQAAAEVVKLALQRAGMVGVPVLDNVMVVDLGRRYTRQPLSHAEPAYSGCPLCHQRNDIVTALYEALWSAA